MKIYTIGHSNRSFEDFLDVLKSFNIQQVIDVRRFPTSKKHPWFSKEILEEGLARNGIKYVHFPELGGFRKEGYRNFAKSEEFSKAVKKLIEIIDGRTSVIMCSEFKWWKCHRKYIANFLSKSGHRIIHIFTKEKTQVHNPLDQLIREKMKTTIYCDKVRSS